MARLTVSVEDETVERLRELAGGERKVGSYLDAVTTWLWTLRDESGQTPLRDYSLRSVSDVNDELSTLRSQVAAQETTVTQIQEIVAKLARRLQAQEDSGQNDA